jgi:hypothetical protein
MRKDGQRFPRAQLTGWPGLDAIARAVASPRPVGPGSPGKEFAMSLGNYRSPERSAPCPAGPVDARGCRQRNPRRMGRALPGVLPRFHGVRARPMSAPGKTGRTREKRTYGYDPSRKRSVHRSGAETRGEFATSAGKCMIKGHYHTSRTKKEQHGGEHRRSSNICYPNKSRNPRARSSPPLTPFDRAAQTPGIRCLDRDDEL